MIEKTASYWLLNDCFETEFVSVNFLLFPKLNINFRHVFEQFLINDIEGSACQKLLIIFLGLL